MIKIFGIEKEVYNHIKDNYYEMIANSFDDCTLIIFKRECALEYSAGLVTISMNYIEDHEECFHIMSNDFWRVEIE